MPTLSRWMIRAALFNLWVGFSIAALILSQKGLPDSMPPEIWQWIPAHVDLLLVGWMAQLAMAVAYWIFPRLPHTGTKRGRERFAQAAAVLVNAGVWAHVITGLLGPWNDGLLPAQTMGLLLQIVGVAAFIVHIWPRVRPTMTA